MGVSTLPTHRRHKARAAIAASLVVPFFLNGQALPNTSKDQFSPPANPDKAMPLNQSSQAPLGQETMNLSALLTQSSMTSVQGIEWIVKSTTGEVLFKGNDSAVGLALQPGSYEVTIQYGNVQMDQVLTLQPESRIDAIFVLNAGALRVLPHLANLDTTSVMPTSETLIYAINGRDHSKLIATSTTPGEIINLAAGTYRLAAHFANSNAEAVTEVEVKAGVMRSVDIALHAGLVHITLNDPAVAAWSIKPDQGEALVANDASFDAVLKPGHYTAEATVAGRHVTRSFTIEDGEEHLIVLDY